MSLRDWLDEQKTTGIHIDLFTIRFKENGMGFFDNMMARFAGKKLADKIGLQEGTAMETKTWYQSKAVWTSIIGAILAGVQPISTAFGHPIIIPAWVFELLGGMGLYSLRTGDKPVV